MSDIPLQSAEKCNRKMDRDVVPQMLSSSLFDSKPLFNLAVARVRVSGIQHSTCLFQSRILEIKRLLDRLHEMGKQEASRGGPHESRRQKRGMFCF